MEHPFGQKPISLNFPFCKIGTKGLPVEVGKHSPHGNRRETRPSLEDSRAPSWPFLVMVQPQSPSQMLRVQCSRRTLLDPDLSPHGSSSGTWCPEGHSLSLASLPAQDWTTL